MEDQILNLLFIFICFELFEFFWQKGRDTKEFIGSLVRVYQKGILLFLLAHPSFYFLLFCAAKLENSSALATLLIVVKAVDLTLKINLTQKVSSNAPLGFFEPLVKSNQPLPTFLKMLPTFIYGTLFYFAFA